MKPAPFRRRVGERKPGAQASRAGATPGALSKPRNRQQVTHSRVEASTPVGRRAWLQGIVTAIVATPSACHDHSRAPVEWYDVVIVGGGLAGLTAAFALRGRRVLLLEAAARLGGRVLTKRKRGVSYESGALMAYEPGVVPFAQQSSRLIRDASPIGLSLAGTTYFGRTPREALRSALDVHETPDPAGLRARAADAFFSVIHPGPRERYIRERRDDWQSPLRFDHFEHGNSELVAAFAKHIRAEIRLECPVSQLDVLDDCVRVNYRHAGRSRRCEAQTAVVATPAPQAAALLQARAPAWLGELQFASGVVATLALKTDQLPAFSYIATPDLCMNCVISSYRDGHRVLTAYFSGERADQARAKSERDLARLIVRDLETGGVGTVRPDQSLFFDRDVWQGVGPIISPETYRDWSPTRLRPLPHIFLAGDYANWDAKKLPYGMSAAIQSGQAAGRAALDWLDGAQARHA